jgi:hypothetical protein
MSNNDIDSLHTSALWYAWGRQDAQHTPGVDVFAFADQYAAIAAAGGHRPSIQDAFATYVAGLVVERQQCEFCLRPAVTHIDCDYDDCGGWQVCAEHALSEFGQHVPVPCPCTPSFIDPRCPQHGAHEYHGVPAATQRCPEVGVRGTQCTQPAGHVDDCTFA